ncbi:TPM domain-containing protein [Pelomicrobium methylotrophicum]|uniref:YgcG family protein n=1 Tax=Pelomicrobium methylotrophicum TaxID=2602750 RepID=A0A5C7EIV7_9PROT|nr:YgcG family protein [Pelomicrobium methylotrophicum]TXF11289.1 YgcG family protein [Pelomicrobium methylotrophicum]
MKRALSRLAASALLAALALALPLHAQAPVPELRARVTDLAGMLSDAQRQALAQRLAAFEKKKGSQIAVLIVPTVRPETIEQYAIRVAEQWKLGRKGVDDGVLVLVARDDRQLRIEVGYGLEGVLSDALAKRIIAEVMVPYFREGDFYGGLSAGIERIIGVIEGEPLPPPRESKPFRGPSASMLEFLFVAGFLLATIGGAVLRALFGRLPAAALVGTGMGLLGWLWLGSFLVASVVGVAAFVFTLTGSTPRRATRGSGGWPGAGGYGWGGGWSGGGFSGGGGSFGGGGASGRW